MAEFDKDQERTEQASPRRREEARKKGQVAKSPEVASAAILLACTVFFYFCSGGMVERLMDLTHWTLRESGTTAVGLNNINALIWGWSWKLFLVMAPLLLTVVIAGFLANYLQIGFIFSTETLTPKFATLLTKLAKTSLEGILDITLLLPRKVVFLGCFDCAIAKTLRVIPSHDQLHGSKEWPDEDALLVVQILSNAFAH